MLLTLDEAAARLTVSVSTVRRLTAAGLLPIIRGSRTPKRGSTKRASGASYSTGNSSGAKMNSPLRER